MKYEVEAIVLAGGNGTRMKELIKDTQKCLLPIDEEPTLLHIFNNLVSAFGSVDIKLGVAYKAEQVEEFVKKNGFKNIKVTCIPHEIGTEGWGIYNQMEPHIRNGIFIATPGDIIVKPSAYIKALETTDYNNLPTLTFSPDINEAITHGTGIIEKGKVKMLIWPPPENINGQLRDMTIWASNTSIFDDFKKYPNPKKGIGFMFSDMIKNGEWILGNIYNDYWIHLSDQKDLLKTMN